MLVLSTVSAFYESGILWARDIRQRERAILLMELKQTAIRAAE
jgi:hypothetical protein